MSNSISKAFSRFYARMGSRRAAVIETVLLILLFLIAWIFPQARDFSPHHLQRMVEEGDVFLKFAYAVGWTDVFKSWWALVFFGAFFLSLCIAFYERLAKIRKEVAVVSGKPSGAFLRRLPIYRQIQLSESASSDGIEGLAKLLRSKRYAVDIHRGGRHLKAMRNRTSVYGSVIFHLSFLFLAVGVAISINDRMHGVILIGEGQRFGGQRSDYLALDPLNIGTDKLPRIDFGVEDIEVEYDDEDSVLDAYAALRIRDGRRIKVRVNKPVEIDGAEVRLVEYGIAPSLAIREPDKRLEHQAAAMLMVLPPGRADTMVFPPLPHEFAVRLFPNHFTDGSRHGSYGRDMKNPVISLEFDAEGKRRQVFVPLGERVPVYKYEVEFRNWVYWARMDMGRDGGKIYVYVAMVLALIGLTWRLLGQRQALQAALEDQEDGTQILHVGVRPDYTIDPYHGQFEKMMDEFEKGLKA